MLRHHLVLIGGLATVALVSSTDAGAQSTAQSIQSGAAAQTTGFQIPQSDVNCDWSTIPGGFGSPRLGTVPPCTTSGTRQVTTVQQSFLFFPPSFFVETSGVYNVSFSGTLQTDGRPGTASTPDFLGLANLQTDVNVRPVILVRPSNHFLLRQTPSHTFRNTVTFKPR